MNTLFDVVVVGGGVVGLTAALGMAKRGYTVAVVDAGALQADAPASDKRVYALNDASQSLLQALDVWPHLDGSALAPYQSMYVWDRANGASIEFDIAMTGTDRLGTILTEAALKQALLEQIQSAQVTVLPYHRMNEVTMQENALRLSSDTGCWYTQLLMIADGARSAVRDALQVPVTTWPYHQQALTCTVETAIPHRHTAYQVFTAEGPLAFLPLNDVYRCSIVWSTSPAYAAKLTSLDEMAFNQEVTEAFEARLGDVRLLSERLQFPLHMRHAKQYHGQRWLLLGDAAHTIHPLAGLGLNLGLADIAVWLRLLDNTTVPIWSNTLLGRYQRERKSAVWKTIAAMDGIKTLFTNPLPPIKQLRGLGLRLCDASTWMKRFFVEQAAGQEF